MDVVESDFKKVIKNAMSCKKRILIIALCVLSYPLNYASMSNGWGFYDKNPKVTSDRWDTNDDKWSKEEIVSTRIVCLVASPVLVILNGAYTIADSATNIDEEVEKEKKDAPE